MVEGIFRCSLGLLFVGCLPEPCFQSCVFAGGSRELRGWVGLGVLLQLDARLPANGQEAKSP